MSTILALTGPIASGKSAVMNIFEKSGIPAISTDALVHQLQKAGTPETQKAVEHFGVEILNDDGSIDRNKLGQLATKDDNVFIVLEKIFIPPLKGLVEKFKQQHADAKIIVIEIPLLFQRETGHTYNYSIACICPEEIRKQRALKRTFMTTEKFEAICKRQLHLDVFKERADFVIETGTTIEDTEEQVKKLITNLSMS